MLKQKTPQPLIFKNSEDKERVQALAQDYTGSKGGLMAAPSGEDRARDEWSTSRALVVPLPRPYNEEHSLA